MVMQLQEQCQSRDDPLLCSDWLTVARCAATFQAGTWFCSLLFEMFLALAFFLFCQLVTAFPIQAT